MVQFTRPKERPWPSKLPLRPKKPPRCPVSDVLVIRTAFISAGVSPLFSRMPVSDVSNSASSLDLVRSSSFRDFFLVGLDASSAASSSRIRRVFRWAGTPLPLLLRRRLGFPIGMLGLFCSSMRY